MKVSYQDIVLTQMRATTTTMKKRVDGRLPGETRHCDLQIGFVKTADGSCLISIGRTRVICTASIEICVPSFLQGKEQG